MSGGTKDTEEDPIASVRAISHRVVRDVASVVEESSRRANRVRETLGSRAVRYRLVTAGTDDGKTFDSVAVAVGAALVESSARPGDVLVLTEQTEDRVVCLTVNGEVTDRSGAPTSSSDVVRLERERRSTSVR